MLQKIKKVLISFSVVTMFGLLLIGPAVTSAAVEPNLRGNLCQGANLKFNTQTGTCEQVLPGDETQSFNDTLAKIINIISVIVGVIAVIMIIFGGFRYITSGGAADKVTSAKNTILYALIGLIIVALAQLIVKFVLKNASI